ncbi:MULTISPECIES: hypothetical protein [Brevundimonas]|uniref:Uncharacterized protein n=1 Tax=Brevundimonas abyssalis TAR-001 TaxID=1391729 RepID=A0A8E0KIA8_9CAUL|nr:MULTISPECIES: hypothetical protein [Brevundimonas]GAD58271.1 hypothetical protein MBEBAB_0521 [Brevundimonas abyssalis TAR-001]
MQRKGTISDKVIDLGDVIAETKGTTVDDIQDQDNFLQRPEAGLSID